MKKILVPVGLALAMASPAWGAGQAMGVGSTQSLEANDLPGLNGMAEEQTRIATRTRLNIDYAPGTVSVLHGEDLLNKGARTVLEALSLVPGFEQSVDYIGTPQVLVRGVGRTYSSGNIKLLVNDVAQNSEAFGLATPVLNMPLEQVERIEVIRGPGSAIYGESALVGVVNVITRQQGQRVFGTVASKRGQSGGGVLALTDADRRFDMSLNVAAWKREGGGLRTGEDANDAEGTPELSNAPGNANDKRDFKSALFNLNYQKFSLVAQWLEDGSGDFFGINDYLPPDDRRIVTRQRHRSIELKQALDFTAGLQGELKLGWGDFTHSRDRLFVGPPATPSDEPYLLNRYYREKRLNAGADMAWETGQHTLLFGWFFNQVKITEANWSANFALSSNWIDTGMRRINSGVTLQDEYRATDSVTITAGLRHDHYDDVGNSTTPRLAAVWQASPGHVFKAQYAEAFRAPTFYEIHNGGLAHTGIKPETVATHELGYVYKGGATSGRATVFHSSLKNLIVFDDVLGYINGKSARSEGVELELERWYGSALKLNGNVSYSSTHDYDTGKPIPGAADWLANIDLEWRASREVSLDVRLRHVGSRSREAADPRGRLAAYDNVDVTARVFNFGYRGLTLRAGIKNLFNKDSRFPALLDNNVSPPLPSYPGDYPQPGREAWAELAYNFN